MPVNLRLSAVLKKARWKVKIQEKKTREPPHVSILRGTRKWRINLRTGGFMDRTPIPRKCRQISWRSSRSIGTGFANNGMQNILTIPFMVKKSKPMVAKREKINRTWLLTKGKARISCFAPLHPSTVSTVKQLRESMASVSPETLWISFERGLTSALLRSLPQPARSLGSAVLLHEPSLSSLPILGNYFDRVVFGSRQQFLPPSELSEVLSAENKADLFIGGTVDQDSETATLWRGNLEALTVPFSAFQPSGDGIAPDFAKLSVDDCGQTVRWGEYEAAADAILYEFSPEYRRRIKKQRQASERSFGASLRRLRKQRGLRREDFSPTAAKTIARIEQNQVQKVQPRTLSIIARKLGVTPEEIESY